MSDPTPVRATIDYLRRCREARAAGYPVRLTTDPAWLLNMAINRRAGWPDDPGLGRGSCSPVGGRYPRKAELDGYGRHLRLLVRAINTPRLIVRESELGEHRWLLERLPDRFTGAEA